MEFWPQSFIALFGKQSQVVKTASSLSILKDCALGKNKNTPSLTFRTQPVVFYTKTRWPAHHDRQPVWAPFPVEGLV